MTQEKKQEKKETKETMTMTNQHNTKNIVEALSLFQQEANAAVKNSNNPFFKSTYASLENVIEAANEGAKFGLAFTQCVDYEKDIVTDKVVTTMFVRTTVMHKGSDTVITSKYPVIPKNNKYDDSQALGSAITYAKRYSLQAIYGLPSEDDDGNANTHNPKVIGRRLDISEQQRNNNVWVSSLKQSLKEIVNNKDLDKAGKIKDIQHLKEENKEALNMLKRNDAGAFNMLKDHFKEVEQNLGGNDEQSNAD